MFTPPSTESLPRKNLWIRKAWIGVMLSCFLLQQLASPLHCFLHEHELEAASQQEHAAAHCPDMHGHSHGHSHGPEQDLLGGAAHATTDLTEASRDTTVPHEDHAPHPVEDHLSKLVERLVLRTSFDPPVVAWFSASSPWRPVHTGITNLAWIKPPDPVCPSEAGQPTRGPPASI